MISPVAQGLYLGRTYHTSPVPAVEPVAEAPAVRAGRRLHDVYEPALGREALPAVTYGPRRSCYG